MEGTLQPERGGAQTFFGKALEVEGAPHTRKSASKFKPPKLEKAQKAQDISLPQTNGKRWSLWKPTGSYQLCRDVNAIRKLGNKKENKQSFHDHATEHKDDGVEFSDYFGIGISLYFKGLKYLMFVFGVLSLLSIPSLALYICGGALDDSNQTPSLLSRTTMANMPNLDLNNATSPSTEIWGISQKDMFQVLSWIDVVASIFYLFAIWFLIYLQHREIELLDVIQTTMSDYTLWAQSLPDDMESSKKLKERLGKYFQNLAKQELENIEDEELKYDCTVANVHLHVESAHEIQLETSLGSHRIKEEHLAFYMLMLQNEKDALEEYFEKKVKYCHNPFSRLQLKWIKMRLRMVHWHWEKVVKKIKSIERKSLESRAPLSTKKRGSGSFSHFFSQEMLSTRAVDGQKRKPVCAFITFRDDKATNALDEYFNTPPRTWMKRTGRMGQCYPEPHPYDDDDQTPQPQPTCFWDPSAIFYGHKIHVSRAPEPDDMKWEDLEVTGCQKFGRYSRTILITSVVLAITLALVTVLEYFDNVMASATEDCAGKEEYSLDHTEYNTAGDLLCWCSYQNYYDIYDKSYCTDYIKDYIAYTSFGYIFVIVIEALNLALEYYLEQSSEFEPHQQRSYGECFLVVKVTLAQICNTALVILFMYAMIDIENYGDYTAPWYYDVGTVLLTAMLFNIFIPQLEPFFLRLVRPFNIWAHKKSCMTQDELNKLLRRPEFRLTGRNSLVLTTLIICMTFSPGLPLLNPIAFATFFVMYWIDKYNLLRFYDRPKNYDFRQAEVTALIMQYAVVTHLLVAIFQWGYSKITFSSAVGLAVYYRDLNIARGSMQTTWMLTTLMVIIVVVLFAKLVNAVLGLGHILEALKRKMCKCKCCKKSMKNEEKNPPFEKFVEELELDKKKDLLTSFKSADENKREKKQIIPSYEILENPMYNERFGITANRKAYGLDKTTLTNVESKTYHEEKVEEL